MVVRPDHSRQLCFSLSSTLSMEGLHSPHSNTPHQLFSFYLPKTKHYVYRRAQTKKAEAPFLPPIQCPSQRQCLYVSCEIFMHLKFYLYIFLKKKII